MKQSVLTKTIPVVYSVVSSTNTFLRQISRRNDNIYPKPFIGRDGPYSLEGKGMPPAAE